MKKTTVLAVAMLVAVSVFGDAYNAQAQLGALKGLADKAAGKMKSDNDNSGNKKSDDGELPKAATDYSNPRASISLSASGYNPNAKMTPTKDAIANDGNASNTTPMYQGATKSIADLSAAYERLPYCLFPYKPYWKFKDDYYFWGKTSHDIIRKQYDDFCLDIIEYPQILADEGTKQKLSRRMFHLSEKRFISGKWLNMPNAIPSGEKGLIPLIECIHHLASTIYAANPGDYDAFTKFVTALHLANMHVEFSMEDEARGIINSEENLTLALRDNMKDRTEFLLQISETNTSWATIKDYATFLVNEFNKINNSRSTRKGGSLLHAFQYCEQAKLIAEDIIPRNKDAQKYANTDEYKKLLKDIAAMNDDDVAIDCYFELSKPIAVPVSKCSDAALNAKITNLVKTECDASFQKAIVAGDWKVFTEMENGVEVPYNRVRPVACIYKFRDKDAMCWKWVSQKWNGSDFSSDVAFAGVTGEYTGDRIKVDLNMEAVDYDKAPSSIDRNAPGNEWMSAFGDDEVAQMLEVMKTAKEKEEADKPFVFDLVYADYKSHVESGDLVYLIAKTDMFKLEQSAQTDEQKTRFKQLKTNMDALYAKEFEWNNNNFASATDNLLAKAKAASDKELMASYIGQGINKYHRYLNGDRKGQATFAQLKKCYDTYTAFIKQHEDVRFGNFMYTPDGKEIIFPRSFKYFPHGEVRKDIFVCYGEVKTYGEFCKVFRNGQLVCKIDKQANIYNASDKKVGMIDHKDRIWINGAVKADYLYGNCRINGKKVGEITTTGYKNQGQTHATELMSYISDGLVEGIIFYFYQVIPQ